MIVVVCRRESEEEEDTRAGVLVNPSYGSPPILARVEKVRANNFPTGSVKAHGPGI
jgi:hypothetical protein